MRRNMWSPYKYSVINYVRRNPGCCKRAIAEHCTRNPSCSPTWQYHIVDTAIRNGWVRAERKGNRYAIYAIEENSEN